MKPFPPFFVFTYIILAMDYVSKWLEVKSTRNDDVKIIIYFVKFHIFCKFGVLKAIISDQGTHFCNTQMKTLIKKYGVLHKVSTLYQPQTNGQAKISNKELKQILKKKK